MDGDSANVMPANEGAVRLDVLQRLAEQAMTDSTFREDARRDLIAALAKHGYDLTAQELALVLRFRHSLADAGVDLDLIDGMGDERLARLFDRLQRRMSSSD
jgi:hypothetical protein